jgi:hypothetical protein
MLYPAMNEREGSASCICQLSDDVASSIVLFALEEGSHISLSLDHCCQLRSNQSRE